MKTRSDASVAGMAYQDPDFLYKDFIMARTFRSNPPIDYLVLLVRKKSA